MNPTQLKLIELAKTKFIDIEPSGRKTKLEDCFTEEDGVIIFWFNTKDNNTHIMKKELYN